MSIVSSMDELNTYVKSFTYNLHLFFSTCWINLISGSESSSSFYFSSSTLASYWASICLFLLIVQPLLLVMRSNLITLLVLKYLL